MKNNIKKNSKNYFDQIASSWDQMRQGFFSEALRDKVFSLSNIQPGTLAVDVGAGTGFMTGGLLGLGAQVIAVDQSLAMLEELDKKFNYNANIDCLVGESEKLPIADNKADYVFANMYLHHVKTPRKAILEMVRILKSGGKLILTDLDAHNFHFLREEHQDRWMGFERSSVQEWFLSAGLNEVWVNCIGENCCASSLSHNEEACISIFIACGVKI
ncbi:class I SAM-dependent methyltransferase [Cellulosilyticum sp. I15G10I2]|uniref:class I SAM-dependent methyltransferase n=1 Tax=Cellulosilyticum sp. I15G10I2 TaxID=1892843 RepID=UPI001FA74FA2|nr:class I SAM-dependent methyltransferase [Cellulosilyticum sp. I15G10I2]